MQSNALEPVTQWLRGDSVSISCGVPDHQLSFNDFAHDACLLLDTFYAVYKQACCSFSHLEAVLVYAGKCRIGHFSNV